MVAKFKESSIAMKAGAVLGGLVGLYVASPFMLAFVVIGLRSLGIHLHLNPSFD